MTKHELRQEIRRLKALVSQQERSDLSLQACRSLIASACWSESQHVLLYHALPDEVDTTLLVNDARSKGKHVYLPRVVGEELQVVPFNESLVEGAFGIKEPVGEALSNLNEINLAIIPGMAFDLLGHRLGRGRGYYDRLLPKLNCKKVGLCFPFQVFEMVPSEAHDVVMDEIICN